MQNVLRILGICLSLLALGFWSIYAGVKPLPAKLPPEGLPIPKVQVRDRTGKPLLSSFSSEWNTLDQHELHLIPPLLLQAFLQAEDQRFYHHHGIDWLARLHALWQNASAFRPVRGASTISEQVVRMLHPRPRSLRSRLIEGIEAARLEKRFSKAAILEFYLNQVPYARQRRGVAQAARLYFSRDLETLTQREMLSLAILVRAPARLDLIKNPSVLDQRVQQLATRLLRAGAIGEPEYHQLIIERLEVFREEPRVVAPHFVRYVQQKTSSTPRNRSMITTLDSSVQQTCQEILDSRVLDLASMKVTDGAALVADVHTGDVLAWVNVGTFSTQLGSQIDAVITQRQPGSTLKPFLYALALSKGWSPATIINDSPFSQPVGAGLHAYRNYSRIHYGDLTLREALGNSLNIPAIKTIQFTGADDFLSFLKRAGFVSLTKPADHYGDGLALGNGEVTLFELVQAYSALAAGGLWRPLRVVQEHRPGAPNERSRTLLSQEISSIISHILSDPYARRLEFGSQGVLRLPVQTAIKTGTSTDYRDAWAIGYSSHFVVGVWLGNLDRSPMKEISGARGPALVLRSIFAHLEKRREPEDLRISPRLIRETICPKSGLQATPRCPHVEELFVSGTEPLTRCSLSHATTPEVIREGTVTADNPTVRIVAPSPGLNLARDPRIPDEHEAFAFELDSSAPLKHVRWLVDGNRIGDYQGDVRRHLWQLTQGRHVVHAEAVPAHTETVITTLPVEFFVR
jgi:penicillin-binding protein 1C